MKNAAANREHLQSDVYGIAAREQQPGKFQQLIGRTVLRGARRRYHEGVVAEVGSAWQTMRSRMEYLAHHGISDAEAGRIAVVEKERQQTLSSRSHTAPGNVLSRPWSDNGRTVEGQNNVLIVSRQARTIVRYHTMPGDGRYQTLGSRHGDAEQLLGFGKTLDDVDGRIRSHPLLFQGGKGSATDRLRAATSAVKGVKQSIVSSLWGIPEGTVARTVAARAALDTVYTMAREVTLWWGTSHPGLVTAAIDHTLAGLYFDNNIDR